jgi:hypothetical protein
VFRINHEYVIKYTFDRRRARGKSILAGLTVQHTPERRTSLLPLLRDMYGEGVSLKLASVARDSCTIGEIVERRVLAPLREGAHLEGARVDQPGVKLECSGLIGEEIWVWKETLKSACHSIGVGTLRESSIGQICDKVMSNSRRKRALHVSHQDGTWVNGRRDVKCLVSHK